MNIGDAFICVSLLLGEEPSTLEGHPLASEASSAGVAMLGAHRIERVRALVGATRALAAELEETRLL